jgi:hypothetical protein
VEQANLYNLLSSTFSAIREVAISAFTQAAGARA